MGVKRLEVRGFKSIERLEIQLDRLNVLIGANGAGKSNFIGVFRLLNQIADLNLQSYVAAGGGANAFLHYGQKQTPEMYIRFDGTSNGYSTYLAPTIDDSFFFRAETAWFFGTYLKAEPHPEPLGTGHKESKLPQSTAPVAGYTLREMKTWKVYHFHDTSGTAGVKQTGDIGDNRTLRADASNLAAFLYRMKAQSPLQYGQIVSAIRDIAPFFRDFDLHPQSLNPQKILLEWKEQYSDGYRNANYLSDGTLRFICLATLLLQPALPGTILIDEPELGLHPAAITLLCDLLRTASKRTQVIVSTQSVPLVNQLSIEDIIVVDREADRSVFRRLTQDEMTTWLDGYGLGDLWEKNVLGGRP